MDRPGTLIVIDGIAGSGKSTILRAAVEWARARHLRTFDLGAWSETNARPPHFSEIADFDAYFTFEPTRQWVGAAIRGELSRADAPYSGLSLAHAFALDRELMYRRFVLPALAAGKTIVQDRSVSTGIAYQPFMDDPVPEETLLALPGNALALSRAPNHLVLTRLDPETALTRIRARNEESKGVFAELGLLRRADERYRSQSYREIFLSRGTTIHELPTNGTVEETLEKTKILLENLGIL